MRVIEANIIHVSGIEGAVELVVKGEGVAWDTM